MFAAGLGHVCIAHARLCAEFIAAGDVAERSANVAVARREENAAARYGINVHIAGRAARGKLAARLNVFQAKIAADRFDLNAAGVYVFQFAIAAGERRGEFIGDIAVVRAQIAADGSHVAVFRLNAAQPYIAAISIAP